MLSRNKVLRFFIFFIIILPTLTYAQVWQMLGPREQDLTSFGLTSFHNMALSPTGVPYIIFQDNTTKEKSIVKRFVNGKWEKVGTDYVAVSYSNDMELSFAPDGSLYVVSRGDVKKLIKNAWVNVGRDNIGLASSLTFSADGTPHLAFSSGNFSNGVGVRKFENGRWIQISTTNTFSIGTTNYNKLIYHNNELYLAYSNNSNSNKITVKELVGNTWTILGEEGFSIGQASYIDMSFSKDGILHVIYQDGGNENKITVKKLIHGRWEDVGNAGLSQGKSGWANINFTKDNTPVIFYTDESLGNKAIFGKFLNGSWSLSEVSANTSEYNLLNTKMRIDDNDNIYVSYAEQAANYGIVVKQLVGDKWAGVGISGISPEGVSQIKLNIGDDKIPYLAYIDVNDQYRASLKRYVSDQWELVGNASFTDVNMKFIDLAIGPNNVPHIVCGDRSQSFNVMKFDGTNWISVGGPITRNQLGDPKITIGADNIPYIVYGDDSAGGRLKVMKFDGRFWVQVGGHLSPLSVIEIAISKSPHDELYVAYIGGNINKRNVTLKKYVAGAWQTVGEENFNNHAKTTGISLAITDDETPYISFSDDWVATKKFANGAWSNVGNYLSPRHASSTSTIISKSGDLIVGFQDDENLGIPKVSTFKNGTWISMTASPPSNVYSSIIELASDKDGEIYIAFKTPQALVARLVSGEDLPPLIDEFTLYATEGGKVSIIGNHFTNASDVRFGGIAASSFTVISPKEIIAEARNGGSGTVYVKTPKGEVAKEGFTFLSAPPVITAVDPLRTTINSIVTITGRNFGVNIEDNIVYFGAVKATVVGASATNLQVLVPPHSTYNSITVLVDGKIAYSALPFNVEPVNTSSTTAEIAFDPKKDFATGKRPQMIRLGDIDGDGKTDVIVTHSDQYSIYVYLNQSTFNHISFASPVEIKWGFSPNALTIADLDGDGKLDIFTAHGYGAAVTFHRNTSIKGNVSFAEASDYRGNYSYSFGTASADLDLDGHQDLVCTAINQPGGIFVYRGVAFEDLYLYVENHIDLGYSFTYPYNISIGDLDGDRYPEIISNEGGGVYIYKNQSSPGKLLFNKEAGFVNNQTSEPKLADLDGDGKLDIITTNGASNQVSIYRNMSTSTSISFEERKMFNVPINPGHLAVADFDGDGLPDLAAVNRTNTVAVLKNRSSVGNIQMEEAVNFDTGRFPSYIAAGDINGDGYADLIVSNETDNTFSVLKNANSKTALPNSGFTVAAQSSTCSGSDNGAIRIVSDQALNYVTEITTGSKSTKYRFTKEINVENLKAGTYIIDVSLEEQSSDVLSYMVVIEEPKPLNVYSMVSLDKGALNLTLAGSDLYYITLNGREYKTDQNTITLPLVKGINALEVKTDLACQGAFTDEFNYSNEIKMYPNPIDRILTVTLDKPTAKNVTLTIFNSIGKVVLGRSLTNVMGGFEVDLSNLAAGIYILKLHIDGIQVQQKIVKK